MTQKLTPAMQQYVNLKKQNPDAILFFRLGDFYEVFWEDAQLCSRLLDLVLTAKNKKSPTPIPMAGMPHHSIDKYVAKLVKSGYKVAIADQMTEPKPGQIVQRKVTSIITPATYIDDKSASDNTILSISTEHEGNTTHYHLAWGDFLQGEYITYSCSDISQLHQIVTLKNPKEIILHKTAPYIKELAESLKTQPTTVISYRDMLDQAEQFITDMLQLQSLQSYGKALEEGRAISFGLLLNYLMTTQQQDISTVYRVRYYRPGDYVLLDDVTVKNLEIFRSSYDGSTKYSLFGLLDACQSSSGSKLLKNWLTNPLKNVDQILQRQLHIAYWKDNYDEAQAIVMLLKQLYDIPRLLTRIVYKTPHYQSFQRLRSVLHDILYSAKGDGIQSELLKIDDTLEFKDLEAIFEVLENLLKPDIDLSNNASEYIRDGYDAEVDELRDLIYHTDKILLKYHQKLIKHVGTSEIKIIFVRNRGYLIEVTPKNIDSIEAAGIEADNYFDFQRIQTLKTAQRYSTPYLDELQSKLLEAKDKLARREGELLEEVQSKITSAYQTLAQLAEAVAQLDLFTAMGSFARQHQYVQPELVKTGQGTTIVQGRHPVIEYQLGLTESFIPNDLKIKQHIHILTGPNMGGKSTFLRQHALIVLMAHAGIFVPAQEAKIEIVDGIFARVGSGDILAKNQSTFMTEMIEVANIVNNATRQSFVIFDELGRGTSTYDGLSITRAIIEYFAREIQCNVLIATHYHELISLAEQYNTIQNFHVGVYEANNEVVFLKKVLPGGMDKSYGLEVAKLAGINADILEKARHYLQEYTRDNSDGTHSTDPDQSASLWSSLPAEKKNTAELDKILPILEGVDINNLTPIQAMQLLIKILELINHKA